MDGSGEKVYLPKLCHIRKKSFWRLSKALLSILESSCYGSKKLSELYFLFCRYWWAAPVINLDQGESSFMAVFSTRGAFFRNAGAKVQFFWAENKNMAKKSRKKSVSIWFIAIYIKLNFAFNIFGKTKVSLRVGAPTLNDTL